MSLPVSWLLQVVPPFPCKNGSSGRAALGWPGLLVRAMARHGAPECQSRCIGVLGGSCVSPANSCRGHLPSNAPSGTALGLGATQIHLPEGKDKALLCFAGDF